MYAFLNHSQQRVPLLRKLCLKDTCAEWRKDSVPQVLRSLEFPCLFPFLTTAVQLEKLYLGIAFLHALSTSGRNTAQILFKEGSEWMLEVARLKKNKIAVLEVIQLPAATYEGTARWATSETAQMDFRTELAGRLVLA